MEKIFENKFINNKEIDRQRYHDDLVAFDLSTGVKVASSDQGNGVIYTGSID